MIGIRPGVGVAPKTKLMPKNNSNKVLVKKPSSSKKIL